MPETGATDNELLQAFARGSRASLETLARRHEAALLGLARGILGGREDLAVDAMQETWVRVIRFAGDFDGRSGAKTWIYRILINQCNTMRSLAARETHRRVGLPAEEGPTAGESASRNGEAREVMRAALRDLGQEKRLTLLLCYHAGLTHEQAADVFEIPLGTLKSRLHAALSELRARMAREGLS